MCSYQHPEIIKLGTLAYNLQFTPMTPSGRPNPEHAMKKTLLAAALAAFAPSALARPHQGPPPPHLLIADQASAAGIDAASVEAVEAVAEAHRADIDALRGEVDAAREALHKIVADPWSDAAEALSAVDALSAAEQVMERSKLKVLLEFKELLTPAQWEALDLGSPPPREGPARR